MVLSNSFLWMKDFTTICCYLKMSSFFDFFFLLQFRIFAYLAVLLLPSEKQWGWGGGEIHFLKSLLARRLLRLSFLLGKSHCRTPLLLLICWLEKCRGCLFIHLLYSVTSVAALCLKSRSTYWHLSKHCLSKATWDFFTLCPVWTVSWEQCHFPLRLPHFGSRTLFIQEMAMGEEKLFGKLSETPRSRHSLPSALRFHWVCMARKSQWKDS